MSPKLPESKLASRHGRLGNMPSGRKAMACAAIVGLLMNSSAGASSKATGNERFLSGATLARPGKPNKPKPVQYNLYGSYPNFDLVQQGYFLSGINKYDPNRDPIEADGSPPQAVLWFQLEANGQFKQYNSHPTSLSSTCHWDELRWNAGQKGSLVYLKTHNQCASKDNEIDFEPGIAFMPKSWARGQKWSKQGVSSTTYYENGVPVCEGINTWQSRVLGVNRLLSGVVTIQTQTNEVQTLQALPGAPASEVCPPGPETRFDWQENFFLGQVAVQGPDGSTSGYEPALVRAMGGNKEYIKQTGHGEWDVKMNNWQPLTSLVSTTE